MKLKSVRIQNYKCIDDSEEFSLSSITCLVGKNESGKSAILEALYKLKPVETNQTRFDDLEEYPRKDLTDYEQVKVQKPANVLTTKWELEEKDEDVLFDKFGWNPLNTKPLTLTKGYDNNLRWTMKLDESIVLKNYLKQLGSSESCEIVEGSKIQSL